MFLPATKPHGTGIFISSQIRSVLYPSEKEMLIF